MAQKKNSSVKLARDLIKNMKFYQEVDWIIWSNFHVDHLD
jgi:hypothetical protein